jgi:hypothetical protein
LDRRLGGSQSRSGHGGEEKNSQPPPGLEPPIIQPVVQWESVNWLYLDQDREQWQALVNTVVNFLVL